MSGSYFGAFTPGGTQYSTYANPGFPANPYGFAAPAATGYATAFQQAAGGCPRPQEGSAVFAYASRPEGNYLTGTQPIYATPLTAAPSGVASVIAGLSAPAPRTTAVPAGTTGPGPTKTSCSSTAASSYTGYDAAVYAAATSYLQSKAAGGVTNWLGLKRGSTTASFGPGQGYGGPSSGGRGSFPRKPPSSRSLQLHYCEICKISCAGPQTYKEHLEGQKHKKKEAQAQGEAQPVAKTKASFRCDLCGVTCTGQDTYNAHIRGAKHQKTLKLHQTLGKPIPSTEPTIIPPANAQKGTVAVASTAGGVKKVIGVPKVEFIGGQKLTTGLGCSTEVASDEKEDPSVYLSLEKEPQPVGEDYVELVKSDDGKTTQYFCKLCDCRFNDMNAKDMHLKGRRHRLQFKKKVDPSLEVEVKTPIRNRRLSDDKMRRDMRYNQRDYWGSPTMYHSPVMSSPMMPMAQSHGPVPLFGGSPMSRQGSFANDLDEQYIMAKHAAIYPSDEEVKAVLTMVSSVERALKTISDHFVDTETSEKEAEKEKDEKENSTSDAAKAPPATTEERLLRGAMRVGSLASGLMLRGDPCVQLVVLCSEKPTVTLLNKIANLLPQHLAAVTENAYDVEAQEEEAAIHLTSTLEKITVVVSLTSIFMREPLGGGEAANKPDPIDVLDKQKCLEALASLRHAKWFQARCANLQSCSIVIRILRDLSQRLPTWMPLTTWISELLVEKVLSSAGPPLSPAEAFRRVFEAISAGVLLPGGPGVLDPCEKEKADAVAAMSPQQREDLTASAQHALRLIAFKQIYKVLGIERSAIKGNSGQRKRTLEQLEQVGDTNENGKKDKKDESDAAVAPVVKIE